MKGFWFLRRLADIARIIEAQNGFLRRLLGESNIILQYG